MRILILPSYFYPESYSSAHLDNDLYDCFTSNGIKVLAYVPVPSRGVDEKTRELFNLKRKEFLFNGNLEINRFSLFKEKKGTVSRAFRYVLSISIQFVKGLFTRDVDLVFLVSTPPIIGIVGALLHKIKKIPFVYVVQDIFPDSLVNTG
ncbi:MAG: glycosyltransferase WbuB, partial [Clostridia bacterium]